MTNRILEEVSEVFGGMWVTPRLGSNIENYLARCYPEAKWEVAFNDLTIHLHATFNSPEEETFYLLKWA